MLNVNPYEDHVSARLLDFFGFKTPWQRGLWTSGTALTLREALQASEAVAAGALSDGSLHHLASHAIILVGKDPGAGDGKQRAVLQEALKTDQKNGGLRFQGVQHRTLSLLTREIEARYLGVCRE